MKYVSEFLKYIQLNVCFYLEGSCFDFYLQCSCNITENLFPNLFSTENCIRTRMGDRPPSFMNFNKKYGRLGLARNLRQFWFIFLFLKLGNLQSLRRCVWRCIAEGLNIHMCCRLFSDILSSDLPWARNCLWTKQNKTVDFNYFCKHENGRLSESSRCSNSFVTANCHE